MERATFDSSLEQEYEEPQPYGPAQDAEGMVPIEENGEETSVPWLAYLLIPVVGLLVAIASAMIGLSVLLGIRELVTPGLEELREASRQAGWERTVGTVHSTWVESREGPGDIVRGIFLPRVRIQYRDGEDSIDGYQISNPAPRRHSHRAATTFLEERFPVGSQVTVFLDPEEPWRHTLDLAEARRGWLWILGGVASWVAAFAFYFKVRLWVGHYRW